MPYALLADLVVLLHLAFVLFVLFGAGLEARRLEDGLPEWRRAGLPVESG